MGLPSKYSRVVSTSLEHDRGRLMAVKILMETELPEVPVLQQLPPRNASLVLVLNNLQGKCRTLTSTNDLGQPNMKRETSCIAFDGEHTAGCSILTFHSPGAK